MKGKSSFAMEGERKTKMQFYDATGRYLSIYLSEYSWARVAIHQDLTYKIECALGHFCFMLQTNLKLNFSGDTGRLWRSSQESGEQQRRHAHRQTPGVQWRSRVKWSFVSWAFLPLINSRSTKLGLDPRMGKPPRNGTVKGISIYGNHIYIQQGR